jgi:hypothetical protein
MPMARARARVFCSSTASICPPSTGEAAAISPASTPPPNGPEAYLGARGVLLMALISGCVAQEYTSNVEMKYTEKYKNTKIPSEIVVPAAATGGSPPPDRSFRQFLMLIHRATPPAQLILSYVCPKSRYENSLTELTEAMKRIDAAVAKGLSEKGEIPKHLQFALFNLVQSVHKKARLLSAEELARRDEVALVAVGEVNSAPSVVVQNPANEEKKQFIWIPRYDASVEAARAFKQLLSMFRVSTTKTTEVVLVTEMYHHYRSYIQNALNFEQKRFRPMQFENRYDDMNSRAPTKVLIALAVSSYEVASFALIFSVPQLVSIIDSGAEYFSKDKQISFFQRVVQTLTKHAAGLAWFRGGLLSLNAVALMLGVYEYEKNMVPSNWTDDILSHPIDAGELPEKYQTSHYE